MVSRKQPKDSGILGFQDSPIAGFHYSMFPGFQESWNPGFQRKKKIWDSKGFLGFHQKKVADSTGILRKKVADSIWDSGSQLGICTPLLLLSCIAFSSSSSNTILSDYFCMTISSRLKYYVISFLLS